MSDPKDFFKKLSAIFQDTAGKKKLHQVADQWVEKSVHLTKTEQELVQAIFGPALDTTVIMKHKNPETSPTAAAITRNVNDIIFYGKYWAEEFTTEAAFNFGNFVHEVTHIWQAQTDFKGDPGHGDYAITVSAGKKFGDYHSEHQGALMEDYARRFLHPSHEPRRIPATPENDALLKQIVEDQFPGAQKLRLALEAEEQKAAANKNTSAPPKGPKA